MPSLLRSEKKRKHKTGVVMNPHTEYAVQFLENHLNKQAIVEVQYDDGTRKHIQSFKKGNITYDFYSGKRYLDLKSCLENLVDVGRGYTNAVFDTLTLPYINIAYNELCWESISKHLECYFYNLRKAFKVKHYIVTLEATVQGQVHCHIILILEDKIAYKFKDKKAYFKNQTVYKQLQDCWKYGHSKPQPIYNTGGAMYELAKYALKGNRNLKPSIKRYRQGQATEADMKKIYLFYYSIKHNKRNLRTSRGILDYNSNKSETFTSKVIENSTLNGEDKEVITLIKQSEQEQRKIVKVQLLNNYHRHRLRYSKNGAFVTVDWNSTISVLVNAKNEILEQTTYKQRRRQVG